MRSAAATSLEAAQSDTSRLQDAIAAHDGDAARRRRRSPAEEELDELVAPVALYPDALLAQVLVAAAFPLQVAKADQLIDASADMGEDELSRALERQEFDPSVLVLMSGFPTVVSRMADDLDWTERLGRRWSPRTRTCWPRCSGCAPRPTRPATSPATPRR